MPVRCALASDPEALRLSLDCRKAFSTVYHVTIFQAVATNAPSVMLFLHWAYGGSPRIFVRSAPNNADPIYAASGVNQGDPLRPLLFALALMGPLRTVTAALPEAHVIASFDDINGGSR
jgi:hypothetical protein